MSRDSERMWRIGGKYLAVGIEMVVAGVMGTMGGWWLDKKLGTEPYLLYFGIVVGIGAAGLTIVRLIKPTKLDKL